MLRSALLFLRWKIQLHWLFFIHPSQTPAARNPWPELGLESLFELLLVLYPLGAEQMNLPHNFKIGLACWILALGVGLRMFWIIPPVQNWSSFLKALVSAALILGFVYVEYGPVLAAYRRELNPPPLIIPESKPAYSMIVKAAFYTQKRDLSGFIWVLLPGKPKQLVPANVCIYLRLTNLQTIAVNLDRFSASMRDSHGSWIPLIKIPSGIKRLYQIRGEDFIDISPSPILIDQLEYKSLGPSDDRDGWLLFEEPPNVIFPNKADLRLHVTDTGGNEFDFTYKSATDQGVEGSIANAYVKRSGTKLLNAKREGWIINYWP